MTIRGRDLTEERILKIDDKDLGPDPSLPTTGPTDQEHGKELVAPRMAPGATTRSGARPELAETSTTHLPQEETTSVTMTPMVPELIRGGVETLIGLGKRDQSVFTITQGKYTLFPYLGFYPIGFSRGGQQYTFHFEGGFAGGG